MNVKSFLTVLLTASLFLLSCKKEEEVAREDRVSFESTSETLFLGETVQIKVRRMAWNGSFYAPRAYDLEENPLGVGFKSSNTSIAQVSKSGLITAGDKEGEAEITIVCSKAEATNSLKVTVKKYEEPGLHTFSQNLGQPLTKDMIVLPKGIVHATMQGLDIDRYGNFYIAWEEGDNMLVRRFSPDGAAAGTDMRLPASGHGDGFSVEQDRNECYFWTSGSLGEPNGGYSGSTPNDSAVRLICRFKFEHGTTKYAEDAEERFYINDKGCRIVDIDTEHGLLACWGRDDSEFVKIYRTSEIRSGGTREFAVTRTKRNAETVSAYDLNNVTPVGTIRWNRNIVCGKSDAHGMYAVQGFCVYDDKVYVEAGFKDEPYATISVLDFTGKVLETRTPVGVSADKNALKTLDVSSDGTFEPEGIHIHNGAMYLGFVGDYKTAGETKHSCIIKLK